MALNYREDFDYSEAIANTQDAAEREQLLTERQNKIDAEGLAGKVPSNEAVATWNGDYQPYSVSSGSSGGSGNSGSSISQLYEAAEAARLKRLEAARQRIQQQLASNLSLIENDYVAGMTQTDINARQSVLTNEEKMAALGLNMGARGAAATSGAAETSRIAIDNQYRSDLNALGQARLTARAAAQDNAASQEAALESEYYTAAENAALQQAQMTLSQYNADRDYSLSLAGLTGFLNGLPTLEYRQYASSLTSQAQTDAYEQALTRWKTTGYVQSGDAAILGVPAGLIEEKGAVSREVAEELAVRVREKLGADLGVGITGLAGPDGDGVHEVGTVFISLADGKTVYVREKHITGRSRSNVRLYSCQNALDMIRRYLNGLPVEEGRRDI